MRGSGDTLIALGVVFAPLSLLSFGGGNAVIADIAQQAIQVQGWTSERQFADLFALSRAVPGPGSMLAALIGWKAAGIGGATVATIAFYVPSAALVLAVARLWARWRGSVWHTAVERGMAPVAAQYLPGLWARFERRRKPIRRRRSAIGAGAPQGWAADLGRIHDPAAARQCGRDAGDRRLSARRDGTL